MGYGVVSLSKLVGVPTKKCINVIVHVTNNQEVDVYLLEHTMVRKKRAKGKYTPILIIR